MDSWSPVRLIPFIKHGSCRFPACILLIVTALKKTSHTVNSDSWLSLTTCIPSTLQVRETARGGPDQLASDGRNRTPNGRGDVLSEHGGPNS